MNKEMMDQILFELSNNGLISPGTQTYKKAREQLIQLAVTDAYMEATQPKPKRSTPAKKTTKADK